MPTGRSVQLFFVFVTLLLSPAIRAAAVSQPDPAIDARVRDAVEQEVKQGHASFADDALKVRRRPDLEELLSAVSGKGPMPNFYFYEMQSAPGTAFDNSSVWIVAAVRSGADHYELYSFEGSSGLPEAFAQFNRFIARLGIAVPRDKAGILARLILETCAADDAGEIVLDESGMAIRLAVQNYYYAAYGDVWRALEAYAAWWERFQAGVPVLTPTITNGANGRFDVDLKKLLKNIGRHPELQEWDLEISRDGTARVLAKQLIFPERQGWVFYDSPPHDGFVGQ